MTRSSLSLAVVLSCGASLFGVACAAPSGAQSLTPTIPSAVVATAGTAAASTSSPTTAPDSQPPAAIADDPLFGCGGMPDHYGLVLCIHDHIMPTDTESAFEVTKRVAWALRGEGAGLLIKNDGLNVVSWQGFDFSAGRICYPDGHLVKVVSDVGANKVNGASWTDNGGVDPSGYVPAMDPTRQ